MNDSLFFIQHEGYEETTGHDWVPNHAVYELCANIQTLVAECLSKALYQTSRAQELRCLYMCTRISYPIQNMLSTNLSITLFTLQDY